MPETSVQRRDEALPDKSGVSMSSISLSLEAETCPEDVRFVRYSRQLCNIVGSVKAFPIQQDEHLLTVVRYVKRNRLRAGLVERAQDWRWSSLRPDAEGPSLDPGPAPRGADWLEFVNTPMTDAEFAAIRLSFRRDRPFGTDAWTTETAGCLGLEYSIRARGRQPRLSTQR